MYLPVLLGTSHQLVQMSNLSQVVHHLTTGFVDWPLKFYIWSWSLAMLQANCFLFALAVVLRGLQGSGLLCVMAGSCALPSKTLALNDLAPETN